MSRDHLLDELLAGRHDALAKHLEDWLGSRRFARFVADHLPKVRKKLKSAKDPETTRDLLLELETAYRLSGEKRLTVVYEPAPGGSSRGPDFAVRYTTKLEVMVEVTRLRSATPAAEDQAAMTGPRVRADRTDVHQDLDARRVSSVLGLKLGQVALDKANVLLIGVDGAPPEERALAEHLGDVRRRVETGSTESLARQGFRSRGEYLKRLEAVSAVVVTSAPALSHAVLAPSATCWHNPHARYPLPNDVRTVLLGSLIN